MKKILIITISVFLCSHAFADYYVNLSSANLTCGSYKITHKSTSNGIIKNCKIIKSETENKYNAVEQEIKFIPDNGSMVECKFYNNQLRTCEIDD